MNGYLLDTHVWLWMVTEPERLSATAYEIIADNAHDLYLSAASTWEISIKYGLEKLPLPERPAAFIPGHLASSATNVIAVELSHTLGVADLPDIHRDPFDRLIIAQAQILDIPIITADRKFAEYDVRLIHA